jgi:hypothetical protein
VVSLNSSVLAPTPTPPASYPNLISSAEWGVYACSTATIPRALRTDLRLVAQSSGDLVQPDYAAGHSPRDISQRQGTGRENRSIRLNLKPPRAAFSLDRQRGFDLR